MADLLENVQDEPPFKRTRVEILGTLKVKRGRTTAKRYGIIFI